jgi:hypothetical protein
VERAERAAKESLQERFGEIRKQKSLACPARGRGALQSGEPGYRIPGTILQEPRNELGHARQLSLVGDVDDEGSAPERDEGRARDKAGSSSSWAACWR